MVRAWIRYRKLFLVCIGVETLLIFVFLIIHYLIIYQQKFDWKCSSWNIYYNQVYCNVTQQALCGLKENIKKTSNHKICDTMVHLLKLWWWDWVDNSYVRVSGRSITNSLNRTVGKIVFFYLDTTTRFKKLNHSDQFFFIPQISPSCKHTVIICYY